MLIIISLTVFIITVLLPWVRAHALWLGILGALILTSLMAPRDADSAAHDEIANSFGKSAPGVAGSDISLKEVFVPDPKKDYTGNGVVTVTKTVGQLERDSAWVTDLSATINNHGHARIYDVYLRCRFSRRPSHDMAESEVKETSSVASDYHYGYIEPGSTDITVRLEPNGYLQGADPSSFTCTAIYEVETSDLLRTRSR
jgi:hypothetical protein